MKPKLLLRIAAILMLLHTFGHSFGALTWKNAPNSAVGAVIEGMQTKQFEFMGRTSTIASFYEGYGIIMIFLLLMMTTLLWLLSNDTEAPLTARLLVPLAIFLLLLAFSEYIYFFPLAAMLTLLAGTCTLFARVRIIAIRNHNLLNNLKR